MMKTLFFFLFSSLALAQQGGNFNYLNINPTIIPSTCQVGSLRVNTSTNALNYCATSNTWSPLVSVTLPLSVANGGTGVSTTSQNFVLSGPTSGSGAPSFRALVSGDIPNNAANTSGAAAQVGTTSTSSASTFFPLLVPSSSTGNQASVMGSGLTFVPSTGVLTATTFTGALSGNATTATSATTATNIAGGANGSIPYQTGSGVTSLLATASGVLIGGTPPSYTTTPTLVGIKDTSNVLKIEDSTDATKIISLNASGNTTGITTTIASTSSTSQTVSIPNITGADTLDTLGLAQTFSGVKTFTPAPIFSSVTASQLLSVNGSKALTSNAFATTPAASTIAEWDANSNLTSNANFSGFTTTATATGTTTLTIASTQVQAFTGSLGQIVKLPTTSVIAGDSWIVWNYSTGSVSLEASGAGAIQTIAPSFGDTCVANAATPTTAAGWDCFYYSLTAAAGAPTFSGLTTNAVMYATSATAITSAASAGTAGQVMTSNGSGSAPSMKAPITDNYAQAYYSSTASWSDAGLSTSSWNVPTYTGSSHVLTVTNHNGITVTAAATNGAGITFTPAASTSIYLITVQMGLNPQGSTGYVTTELTDGTNVLCINPAVTQQSSAGAASNSFAVTMTCVYVPGTASAVTVSVEYSGNGNASLESASTLGHTMEWTVLQLN